MAQASDAAQGFRPDFAPDFEKMNGLVPAIAQCAATGEVLMMAWMNEAAWDATLATGEAHYFSRSRGRLWHKGGTSGHTQHLPRTEGRRTRHLLAPRVRPQGGLQIMSGNNMLKIGIPKGSLEEATVNLFARSGWKIRKHHRNYFPEINDPELTARLCRVQEIPRYLEDGVLDVGLTGKDWLLETGADVVTVSDLV